MKNSGMNTPGIIKDAAELRRMIAAYPDLPIAVLAGEDSNSGDYSWMYCSSVSCAIGKILDVHTPYDRETVFTDEEEFEDEVSDGLYNETTKNMPEEEFDALVKAEVEKYKPYWKSVIAVYVDN